MHHLSLDETLTDNILDVRIVRLLASVCLSETKAASDA